MDCVFLLLTAAAARHSPHFCITSVVFGGLPGRLRRRSMAELQSWRLVVLAALDINVPMLLAKSSIPHV